MSRAISNYHLSFLFLCCFISLFFSSTHIYSSLNDFEQFPHLRTMSSVSTQVLDTILCHFFHLVKVKSKWQRNPVLKRTAYWEVRKSWDRFYQENDTCVDVPLWRYEWPYQYGLKTCTDASLLYGLVLPLRPNSFVQSWLFVGLHMKWIIWIKTSSLSKEKKLNEILKCP